MAITPDSAPVDSAQSRDFLQARLTAFTRLMMLLNAGFYLPGVLLRSRIDQDRSLHLIPLGAGWHLGIIGVLLATWLLVRRSRLSAPALLCLDAGVCVVVALGYCALGHRAPTWSRADLFVLFMVAMTNILRAAFVPSSARRSAAIAIASLAPVVGGTYLYYRASPLPDPSTPALLTASVSSLATMSVILVAVVSRTVHRLRERVRQALQLGQYTLEEKIGQGGMGVVWRARHALLRRPTAIKLLASERTGEKDLARFELEVQLTSVLNHPNTVHIYDYGRTPDGIFYYAMEYLDGLDLQKLVDSDGPQDPARVIHLLAQVCGSLEEAHLIGLVHRDIKPANLLVCERAGTPDLVKVLDFGLAKPVVDEAHTFDAALSMAGQIVGTPHFLSPEAITGAGNIDGRSDLYAVGAVGYFLLTGTTPFAGRTAVEICGHHLHTPVTPPSVRVGRPLPAGLEGLVMSCLAKSAADRPQDAAALGEALRRLPEAATWTRERALAWWRTHGRSLRERLAADRAPPVALQPTIMRVR